MRQSTSTGAVVKRRTRRDIRLEPCCSNGDRDVVGEDGEGCVDSDEWAAANTTTAVAFLALLLWLLPCVVEVIGRPRPVMRCVSPEGVGVARLNIRAVLPLNLTLVKSIDVAITKAISAAKSAKRYPLDQTAGG